MTTAATTELEAINIMLAAIGEAPVNSLIGTLPVDVKMAQKLLNEQNKAVQSEGWSFNREFNVVLTRDNNNRINITKTTAPHAWSYGISMQLNIPHGHSIWITLPKIYALHCKNESSQNMIQTMAKLNKIIGIDNSSMVIDFFDTFLENLDIKTSLSKDLNISSSDRKILSEKVNMERMSNNPIKFSQENINYIFDLN